jgi:hypothetical protein
MPYELDIEIAGLPRGNAADNRHWRTKKREREAWFGFVAYSTHGKRPPLPLKHAEVTLTRYSSVEPDADNLRASFKPVMDALTARHKHGLAIIEDDAPTCIGHPRVQWRKAKPRFGKIRIQVRELTEGETNESSRRD